MYSRSVLERSVNQAVAGVERTNEEINAVYDQLSCSVSGRQNDIARQLPEDGSCLRLRLVSC